MALYLGSSAVSVGGVDRLYVGADQVWPVAGGDEAETTALLARMTTQPDATRKGHINTLIASLKAEGIWSKLDCFFMFAAHDQQAAYLDWIADRTAVNVGTGPNFTANGYISNVASADTNYLNTGVNASTAGRNAASHFGAMARSSGWYKRILEENAGYVASNIQTVGNSPTARIKFAGYGTQGGSIVSVRAHLCAVDDGSNQIAYRDGASTDTDARDAGSYLGTWRVLSHSEGANAIRAYCFHFGGALTAGEVAALNTAIDTYLDALGV